MKRTHRGLAALAVAAALTLGGCAATAATTTTSTAATTTAAAQAAGAPPGGSTTQTTPLGAVTYTADASETGKSYGASAQNTSGVLVTGGSVTLADATVNTTGSTSSNDESSFYGLNAGVLVKGGSLAMTGGSVTTTGTGANGVFAYGTGKVTLDGVTITASAQGGHGIMASGGGTIVANNVNASSAGQNSGIIATDRGGGTITATGGTYTTTGADSPVIYSTGVISVTGITGTASGSEAVVIEGANSATVTDSSLSGAKKWGVMIYQSMSGDAQGTSGAYTQTGGSLSAATGPLFYVTNTTATIKLSGVQTDAVSGVLLKAAAGQWGASGSNGGTATLTASAQKLSGSIEVDASSGVTLALTNGSAWTGSFDAANTGKATSLTLDASSSWTVSADSHVQTLSGLVLSGTTVTNITGNGHTVYYSTSANPTLGGATYALAGGGQLVPES